MKKNVELGIFDYALVMVSCSISLFALGESLSKHALAIFLAVGAIASISIGYLVSRSPKVAKIRGWDGYMWLGLAILATVLARPLNEVLPEEGFPYMLYAGSWLSWLVIFCGLASWRDQTLLFLNLPCLSAFALVGTFDTFAPATVLFFLFLVSSSLLYARMHQRAMIVRARLAGHEDPKLLYRDSWRWMAGPEWALASAGSIVVFSLAAGPLLRFTLEPMSGSVKVALPQSTPGTRGANTAVASDIMVGRGPVFLDETVLFKVKLDHPDYLRGSIYTNYSGSGWSRLRGGPEIPLLGLDTKTLSGARKWLSAFPQYPPLEPMEAPLEARLSVTGPIGESAVLLAPGPIRRVKVDDPGELQFAANGLVSKRGASVKIQSADIVYLVPNPDRSPGPASLPSDLKPVEGYFLRTGQLSQKVVEFAQEAAANGRTDYDRAYNIQLAISQAASYTLKPPALIVSKDAVEQFLFETKKGYCDLFATAMTVCARAAGLPARYVTGFLVSDADRDSNGYFPVRSKDAHAWCEVFVRRQGWVKFDATIGAQVIDDVNSEGNLPWYRQPWVPWAFGLLLTAMAVAAFLLWKPQPMRVRTTPARSQAAKLTQEFDRAVRKRSGSSRRFSQTVAEYVYNVLPKLGDGASLALEIVPKLERASFGPDDTNRQELAALSSDIKRFRRHKRGDDQG